MSWQRDPVEFFATEAHYVEHLAPIWRALPDEARGTFHVGASEAAAAELARQEIPVEVGTEPWAPSIPTVVASWYDLRFTGRDRPVAFVEHGVGQTYDGVVHGGWAGGEGREAVSLFLCPSERVARANLERYPNARAVAVGCPKLDPWHAEARTARAARDVLRHYPDDDRPRWARELRRPVVAFTWHWDCPLVPETRATWAYWLGAVAGLARQRSVDVIGHAHPRAAGQLHPLYLAIAGVEWVPRFGEVLDRADLLCADNTSALYEFASLDRPILALNHPEYRRDVDHGLRFWRPPGLMVDDPALLDEFVGLALHDSPAVACTRAGRVDGVYHLPDGRAADRAAQVLLEWARW